MDSLQVGQHMMDSVSAMGLLDSPATLKEMVIDTLLHNEFLQGGALLGAIAGLAMYLKSIPLALWRRFVRSVKFTVYFDDNDRTYDLFTKWFNEHHPKKFKNIMVDIKQGSKNIERSKRFSLKISQNEDWNWFWYKGNIIFASKTKQILENASSPTDRYLNSYILHSFFSKRQMLSLLEELRLSAINAIDDDKNEIFYNSARYGWNSIDTNSLKTFENIFLEDKQDLIKDLETFKRNTEHYNKLGISAKRGYLFYGPPGNGKTTLAVAMGNYLERDVYFINLASVSSDAVFMELVANMNKDSIIVFEDIDSFNKDRMGEKDKTGVSFSALLNILNGALEPNNCIIVMTTNHKEALDPALIRPGRIDKIVHLDNPTWGLAKQFVSTFYEIDIEKHVDKFTKDISNSKILSVPMSQIQDWCLQNPDKEGYKKVMIEILTKLI